MANVTVKSGSFNGGVLGDLSAQWFSRPADERITGASSWEARENLVKAAQEIYQRSTRRVMSTHALELVPHGETGLVIRGKENSAAMTEWAATQIMQRAGVPVEYMKKIHKNPALVAQNVTYGLRTRSDDRISILLRVHGEGSNRALQLQSANGPDYGWVPHYDVASTIHKGLGENWTVPGIFGKKVGEITKQNTSLFLGERDMMIGLSDETNKIEVPNRRDGKSSMLSRGILVRNSEVGYCYLEIMAFLFDYCCANRNFWGVEDFVRVKIRHSSRAPDRWLYEAQPAITKFLNASTKRTVEVYKLAAAQKIDDVQAFLKKAMLTRPQIEAVMAQHVKEEHRPIETVLDANNAVTAYARDLQWQDDRLALEQLAAGFMPKVKA